MKFYEHNKISCCEKPGCLTEKRCLILLAYFFLFRSPGTQERAAEVTETAVLVRPP